MWTSPFVHDEMPATLGIASDPVLERRFRNGEEEVLSGKFQNE
jgi:hypothetical protein